MKKVKKILINSALSFATTIVVLFLWRNSILAAMLIFCIGVISLFVLKEKKYTLIYIIVGILGPAAEIFAINFGVWSYAKSDFLGIPYWLPFVWAQTGTYISSILITLNYFVKKKK